MTPTPEMTNHNELKEREVLKGTATKGNEQ
jgi:hypothetical protein